MKTTLTFLFGCLILSSIHAQQDKQFTHYMFDRMSYNPATTGFKGICGTFIYRNQWDRVQDAPNTSLLNVQANIPRQNLGVGLSFTNDAIGFQRNNTLTLNGAYHLPTNIGHFSAGIGLGIVNVGFSPVWIPPQTDDDPILPDPISGTIMDANMGIYFHGSSIPLYVGISTTHLVPQEVQAVNFNVARHYYVLAGYNISIRAQRKIDLKPSILLKSDGTSMVFDLNIAGDIWLNTYSYLWGGLSYRMSDAVAFNMGYAFSPAASTRVNMIKIGYSFDIMTNPLRTYGKGTHELMLNVCVFPPPKAHQRHGNPFVLD